MSLAKLTEIYAREALGFGLDWCVYRWKAENHGTPAEFFEVVGAVAPLRRSGPNAGTKNWRRLDPATRRKVAVQPAVLNAWIAEWESRTGHCRDCMGSGRTIASWSIAEGTKHRACVRCAGSGAAAVAATTNPAENR